MQPSAILSILVQAKGIQKTSAELEKLNATAKKSAKGLEAIEKQQHRTADSTTDLNSRFSNLDNTVGDFNRTMTGMRNIVGLVKFPALITGAGMATQAIGALGSGAVALTSALAPLSGAGLAGAAGMVAIGQAAGVAKLATIGLDDAIKGQKGAMDKLSPVQRAFVKDIRALGAETRSLRGMAQRGLLPGLDKALKTVLPLIGVLKPIVGQTAQALGGLARAGARVVATWGSDLKTVGQANVTVIKNLGSAAIIAADGARHLVVVAEPLLQWLSKLSVMGAIWVRGQIVAGRESGKLAGFLGKTKDVMSTMGLIIRNLATGLFNIGKAAAPLGRDLLGALEKLTAKFKEWTASASGRNALDDYFRSAREPILQIVGLIGDLGAAFLRLSTGTGASSLVVQLRSLVPILENVIANTTAAFGPALITALGNVLRLFGQIAGSSGPLVQMVRLIGLLAGGLADLLQASPVLNSMTVSTIGLYGSFKALSLVFGPLIASAKLLGLTIVGTTAAENLGTAATLRQKAALVATAAAMYVAAAAAKVFAAGQWLLNAALTANPIGLVIVGLVALGVGLVVAYKKVEAFRNAVNTTFSWIKSNWPLVLGILTGPIGLAVAVIAKNWSSIKAAFSSGVSAILGILRGSVGAMAGAGKAMGTALINAFKSALNFAHQLAEMMRDLISKAPGYALGVGQAIVRGIINGIKSAASGIGSALKGAVKDVTPGFLGIGEGIGKGAAVMPKAGKGSAALMGANSALSPFARIGASMGLSVSSGRQGREGKLTSSGNISYHSTGEAIDMSNGFNTPQEMAFFKYMRSHFGSRLAELIFTPGGVGIKDGKPYTYTGKVAADHYDHVHVALDTGKPGPGDGIGRAAGARKALTGDGLGLQGLANLWVQAGGDPKIAGLMARIAQAESGGNPDARNPSGATGLWQILGAMVKGNLTNPMVNARNAVAKYKSQGLGAWAASRGAWGKYVGHPGVSAGKGAASKKKAAAAKVNPFEQKLASADLAIAQTKTTGSTKVGGVGGRRVSNAIAAAGAIRAKEKVIGARIKKIRAALKGKLAPATRLRLTQELAQRIGEHTDLDKQATALLHPAATADVGGGGGSDIGSGDGSDAAAPVDDNTAAIDALTEELRVTNQKLELQATLAQEALRKYNVSQTDYGTLQKALAAIVSGEIGGKIGLGFMTPGFSGGGSRY